MNTQYIAYKDVQELPRVMLQLPEGDFSAIKSIYLVSIYV